MQQLAEEYLHSAELLDQRIRLLRGILDQLYGKEYLHALRRNTTKPEQWDSTCCAIHKEEMPFASTLSHLQPP